jgi:hypothetical protein
MVCCGGLLLLAARHAAASSQLPSVALLSPPFGALLSEGDTIELRANASDADGTVTAVEFYANGALLGEDRLAPHNLTWSNLVAGVFDLTAVAVDDTLERSTSSISRVTVGAPGPKSLYWSPPDPALGEWNGTAFNWRSGGAAGPYTQFHTGDSVTFHGGGTVFIGENGTPGSVSPAAVLLGGQTIQGGDILSGSLTLGTTTFSNYSGSLSFPGGTTIGAYPAYLKYDVSGATNGAVMHFGTGPINLRDGTFLFDVKLNQSATLENDFVIVGNCTLGMGAFNKSNTVARFTGQLNLGGRLNVSIQNGRTSWFNGIDAESHEWAGPVVLDQNGPFSPMLSLNGSYLSKGLVISGPIRDAPGSGTNRLTIQDYAVPFVRLTGSNTYAQGTFIRSSPSAPKAVVEVGPDSSLGTGNVEVEGGGVLRLMGHRNIASTSSIIVQGLIQLEPGVKARVSSLKLGGTTFTSGLFTGTNGFGYLSGNGTIRLPATNLLPTVSLTAPQNNDQFRSGESITMRASASDADGYIQRVEYFLNGALMGARTNAPYNFTVTNPPSGTYPLAAVAHDDDGGARTSLWATVTVTPRIERLENLTTGVVVIQFNTSVNRGTFLQSSETLAPPAWTNIAQLSAETPPRTWRVTNALPAGVNTRFYRLAFP